MLAAGRICRAACNTAPAPALWQCLQAALGASASSSGALSFSTDSSTVNSSTASYSGTGSYTGTGAYSATGTQSSEEVIGSDEAYSSSIEAIGSDVYDEDLGFESYDTVDFGFQEVPREQKVARVGQVFSSVAQSYDVMNDVMSGGLHRLWKDRFVSELMPFPGMQHLDVAGGTGDVAFRVLRAIRDAEQAAGWQQQQQGQQTQQQHHQQGHVTVCDINPQMLEVGRARAASMGFAGSAGLSWVEGNAEVLPFEDSSMDAYTIAFGIRNVTDRPAALREAYRVLKRGGRFLCLEFSQVTQPVLRQLYDTYSLNVIPKLGAAIASDEASYQYLVESIRRFPDQDTFASMLQEAGFKAVEYENLTGGVVAMHSGFKL